MDSIKCWRIANLVLTVAWITMIPIAVMTGWIYSIAFVSAASIYANAASHLAAWRSDVPSEAEKKVLDKEDS
jgi:hypothetical protein